MIAEKQGLRAALAAAICAFGVSFGAVFCPVSAFGLPVDSWALLLVCLAASIVFSVIFAVFRPVYGFGAAAVAAGAFAWFFHGEALLSAMGLLGGSREEYVLDWPLSIQPELADAAARGGRRGRNHGARYHGGAAGALHGLDGSFARVAAGRLSGKSAVSRRLSGHFAD